MGRNAGKSRIEDNTPFLSEQPGIVVRSLEKVSLSDRVDRKVVVSRRGGPAPSSAAFTLKG